MSKDCPKCGNKNVPYGNRGIKNINDEIKITYFFCEKCKTAFNHDGEY